LERFLLEELPMVDKAKRMEAAKLIEDFLSCRITNLEYDGSYPCSDDPALLAIYSRLWFAYSDIDEHRMDGKHALSSEGRQVAENCILFLKTEVEYRGPTNFISLSAPFKRLWHKLRGTTPSDPVSRVWPFDTPEQLETARHEVSHEWR
jgi:hypothetical protein